MMCHLSVGKDQLDISKSCCKAGVVQLPHNIVHMKGPKIFKHFCDASLFLNHKNTVCYIGVIPILLAL